nr:MAG: hypothetical protein [Bacteriophage sp.]
MGVEVKGAGDGVVIADRGDIEIIPVGALDGEPLVVHW